MGHSQHKVELRECPVCHREKVFPVRNLTCSAECAFAARREQVANAVPVEPEDPFNVQVLAALKMRKTATVHELSELFDKSERTVRSALDSLRKAGHNIYIREDNIAEASEVVRPGNAIEIVHPLTDFYNRRRRIGIIADNHLGSKHERLDVLHSMYDLYKSEGITEVYNAGNWIEGESRFNRYDIEVYGMDRQLDYWIKNYPQRDGITTYYVAGDDHEGWYQQREQVEIGRYAEMRARQAGREDLVYLGYVEADVKFEAEEGFRYMRLMHPGGISSYALSYPVQRLVESFQGGEKPAILIAGHYHKFDYNYYREVFIVQPGTTEDQSIFMRKRRIQAHVGGCIVEFNQAPDGQINRFKVEFVPFYDRGFYTGKIRRF